jgi:hypothetical protein
MLATRSRVALEKPTVAQLVKKPNEGSQPFSYETIIQISKLEVKFRNRFNPEDGRTKYLSNHTIKCRIPEYSISPLPML